MEENREEESARGNKYSLPYGLCKKYDIFLHKGATPRDAWNALAREKGITPQQAYEDVRAAEKNNLSKKYEDNPEYAGQIQRMSRMKRVLADRNNIKEPITFERNTDGSVSYRYVETGIYYNVHGGKMIDPAKNDTVRRDTVQTGIIGKDGLWRKNKPIITETLIKRGKR